MKAILSIVLLSSAVAVQAQTSQTAPFKGANTIIVVLPDSGTTAWKKTAQLFADKGYAIKFADKDLLTISTEPKDANRATISLSASIQKNILTLKGMYVTAAFSGAPSAISYRGMKGSPTLTAWGCLQEVATAYPSGVVTYAER